jgi:ribosomal protein S18 acetylase RimI-like enzyme
VSHVDLLNRRLLTSNLRHVASWTLNEALGERHDLHSLKSQTGAVIDVKGTVRPATSEDLNAVLELDRAAPVGRERSALLTARVQSGEMIIFERGGRALGYAVVRTHAFFGRDFVELLAVAFGDRRNGIGSFLIQSAVDSSTTERIFTSTNQSNIQMIGLLEKAGWQFSGQLEGIDEGDPELVYYKDLSLNQ